jgi:hypothetical protein
MKVIKDHHRDTIVQVKFCDFALEKPHLSKGANHSCKDCSNVGNWMVISIDSQGKVVQNLI